MGILESILPLGRNRTYYDAIELYNRFRYREAIEKFDILLKLKKRSNSLHQALSRFYCGQAHRNLGEIFFATGDYKSASEEFDAALELTPNNVELNRYLGLCFGNLDKDAEAYSSFTKVLQQDPTLLPPESKLAMVFYNLKLWDRAEQIFVEILKQNSNFADINYQLGVVYQGKRRILDSIKFFKKALKINPQYREARLKLSVSEAYIGKFGNALSNIQPIIEQFSSHADVHYTCGIIHMAENTITKAIESFQRAVKINPRYKKARIKLGILLLRISKVEEGLEQLESVSQDDIEDKALQTMVHSLKGMKNSNNLKARDIISLLKPTFPEPETQKKAEKDLANYLVVSPGFSDMLSILNAMPQNDTAIIDRLIPILQETIDLHPEYCDIHNSLGTFYIKAGMYQKAIESFQEARKINPRYIKARINLFNAIKEYSTLEEALIEGVELIGEDLPYPDFMCAMGEVYLSMKKNDEALTIVERILVNHPEFSPAHFLLAQIYNRKGDSEKVSQILKKCLD